MAQEAQANNRRIARNTIALYIRMFCTMVISLFTSRIILDSLGISNYGIYNVVGGFVSIFAIMSSSLTNSISRFLTFELGKGDLEKLKRVFPTSLNVMFALSIVVLTVGETAGLWFINCKANIPNERLEAANFVYQLSIATFIMGLISVPYNASIISHEKMKTFAYIGIFEVVMKLIIVYALYVSPFDKLKIYALLLFLLSLSIRLIYGIYCNRNFQECHYRFIFDKPLLRQMTGFAGWNFLGQGAYQLNNSGVNLLINIFFGVTLNAARGIAVQVNNTLSQFTSNFMVALTPQITKSYAAGQLPEMHDLIFRGAKFSYFLCLLFLIPICIETDYILNLWLIEVPDYTVSFVRWSLYITAISMFSGTLITALHATGNIKRYMIIVGLVEVSNFPITYMAFKLGANPLYSYYIYFGVYLVLMFLRLYLVKDLIKISGRQFMREVYAKSALVSAASVVPPLLVMFAMPSCFLRLVLICIVSCLTTVFMVYALGFTDEERNLLVSWARNKWRRGHH